MVEEKSDVIKLNGKKYKREQFLIEENHPAVGRILIIDDKKFKVLDDKQIAHRSGTFIAPLTEDDEDRMQEYDDELDSLSEKLTGKVDIKRLIKENIKDKSLQEIKTGLFILKALENGEDVEIEHHKGCYQFKMHYKNQTFELVTGVEVSELVL